jgi:ArsR family transcriptional regulator
MPALHQQPHELFQLLSESIRLRILCLLQVQELCVCDLVEILDLPQPTVSRHLLLLKAAGLIEARRAGSWAVYRLRPSADALWAMALDMIAEIRARSPEIQADAKAAKTRPRPACTMEDEP